MLPVQLKSAMDPPHHPGSIRKLKTKYWLKCFRAVEKKMDAAKGR
jgi:hypothetical protein